MSDLDAFAAQVAAMDLVISVSNTTVHMSGALGVPTWVMLNTVPLPCWLLERDDSPWYPSVRLFRQSAAGDWANVTERIGKALAGLAGRSKI
jgi:ADP-heptose:LPS heptosyltransferase